MLALRTQPLIIKARVGYSVPHRNSPHNNQSNWLKRIQQVPTLNKMKSINRTYLSLKMTVVTAVAALFLAGASRASVIWTCGTSLSTFKGIEFQDNDNNYGSQNGSSVTRISDDGGAWKFHKDD